MPTSGDACSTCFFAFAIPASGGSFAGKYACAFNAPNPTQGPATSFLWPIVASDWWCGHGVGALSGIPFNASVSPTSGRTSQGTITFTAQSTKTVTDAACTATSKISYWIISGSTNVGLIFTPGAGTFDVRTVDGSSITAVFGYSIG